MTDSTRRTDSAPNGTPEPRPTAAESNHRPPRRESRQRLNPWVVALVLVIIGGAFAFSADSWIKLAESAGFTTRFNTLFDQYLYLSWLLPFVVDAYTALTMWLYLGAPVGSKLRDYAGKSAFTAAGLSVLAQGAYHGLTASDVHVDRFWPLVVAIGAVPPALLASAIHLLATYLAEHRTGAASNRTPVATRRPDTAAARQNGATRHTAAKPTEAPAPQPASPPRLAAVHDPDAPEATDEQIADAIRRHVLDARRDGVDPVQREMQRLVLEATGARVGQRRCVRIAKTITAAEPADDSKEESRGHLAAAGA